MAIIQTYAQKMSHSDSDEEIVGDFNEKVGEGTYKNLIGNSALGVRRRI